MWIGHSFLIIFTDRIRSMGKGYVFTRVCHSVHNWGVVVVSGLGVGVWFGRGGRPPSPRRLLPRSVRILLECILVFNSLTWKNSLFSKWKWEPCLTRQVDLLFLTAWIGGSAWQVALQWRGAWQLNNQVKKEIIFLKKSPEIYVRDLAIQWLGLVGLDVCHNVTTAEFLLFLSYHIPWFPKIFPWFFLSFYQDILVIKSTVILFKCHIHLWLGQCLQKDQFITDTLPKSNTSPYTHAKSHVHFYYILYFTQWWKFPWFENMFLEFGWKCPIFPWFPWLEKVFKIFPDFPDKLMSDSYLHRRSAWLSRRPAWRV